MKYTSEFTAAEIDQKLKEIAVIKQNLSEIEEYLTALQTAVDNKAEKTEIKADIASIKSDIAMNRTTLGVDVQCKNLLENTAVTKTVSGITFAVNSDKSITINGTNESNDKTILNICDLKSYGEGKFIASCKSSDTNIYMSLLDESGTGLGAISDNELIWNSNGEKRSVRFAVKGNATIDNVTVYPMIRYADIADDTYVPYVPTIQSEIDNIMQRLTALEGGA